MPLSPHHPPSIGNDRLLQPTGWVSDRKRFAVAAFFANSLKANAGDPRDSIFARFGATVKIAGIAIAMVLALHSNGLDPDCILG